MNIFMIIGLVFATLSALLHVLIVYMEIFAWEGPLARKTFGGTAEEARPFAFFAYNQGLYNGFLAVEAGVGIVLVLMGHVVIGSTLIIAATASMMSAAVGLVLKDHSRTIAAVKQGTFPFISLIFMIIGLID
ncbi:DUF1304 domain-containing protein [Alloscardovia omnicolens]|uniref:DUF1304 domain-containing protein n=1 Tax=Alloscardovia omnicolens TaxID=419015 RepID=UPI003A6BCB1F